MKILVCYTVKSCCIRRLLVCAGLFFIFTFVKLKGPNKSFQHYQSTYFKIIQAYNKIFTIANARVSSEVKNLYFYRSLYLTFKIVIYYFSLQFNNSIKIKKNAKLHFTRLVNMTDDDDRK